MKSIGIALGGASLTFAVLLASAAAAPPPRAPACSHAGTLRTAVCATAAEGRPRRKVFLPPPRFWGNPWRWQYRLRPTDAATEGKTPAAARDGD